MTRNCRARDTATWNHRAGLEKCVECGKSATWQAPQMAASVTFPQCSEAESAEAAVTDGAERGVSGGLEVLAVTSLHSPGTSAGRPDPGSRASL